ncbi:MAG: aminoacyl-tRNA hydrolase [Clostridia bacterium]|nr:aminoacyl-tRNA hydrolase [Clostridia bacterium]
MKLIVGLGNPDKEYLNTFHNLGFMAVEECARLLDATFTKIKCRAQLAETRINGQKVILAKPQTYMNLSGESVRELVTFFKIDISDLVVLYDDYDLEKGALRLRENGSAGTHNGMRNIVKELGTENFKRIRIGFKPDTESKIPLLNLVLSGISEQDKPVFEKAITRAANSAKEFAEGKTFQSIMQKYNGKSN